MPFLHKSDKIAAAGTVSTIDFLKPAGKVVIRKINLASDMEATFIEAYGYMWHVGKAAEMIGLYREVIVNILRGKQVFNGEQIWPDGWKIELKIMSQTGQTFYALVEYDILEPDPRKKGWGQ